MAHPRTTKDVTQAIAKLTSLHDGDQGVIETIACGLAAIPALRTILFKPEPSGLYETRRRAVEALAQLRAFDILREYLAYPPNAEDPVERAGDDAVINAAARALGTVAGTPDMSLLLALLKGRQLPGLIDALAHFRQISAMPYYLKALGDDIARESAEKAIARLGARARDALVAAALAPDSACGRESSMSALRRRSALKLLQAIPPPRDVLREFFAALLDDTDPWIVFWTAKLWIAQLDQTERMRAAARLLVLLKSADTVLAREIEECFVANYDLVRAHIDAIDTITLDSDRVPIWRSNDYTRRVFERVKRRVAGFLSPGVRKHE